MLILLLLCSIIAYTVVKTALIHLRHKTTGRRVFFEFSMLVFFACFYAALLLSIMLLHLPFKRFTTLTEFIPFYNVHRFWLYMSGIAVVFISFHWLLRPKAHRLLLSNIQFEDEPIDPSVVTTASMILYYRICIIIYIISVGILVTLFRKTITN